MDSIVPTSGLAEEQVKSNYHYKVIGFFLEEPRLIGKVLLLPFSAESVPCRTQHLTSPNKLHKYSVIVIS